MKSNCIFCQTDAVNRVCSSDFGKKNYFSQTMGICNTVDVMAVTDFV